MNSGASGVTTRYSSALFQVGTIASLSDLLLLERFAYRRDEVAEIAFAELVERHGPMVLRVCRSELGDGHEAEDAFQATFLVLASRARAIRRGDSVGSWLHGVALRVANRARWRAARRRYHERRHAEMTASAGAVHNGAHGPPDDVGQVLHEEIGRLPEKYRNPVVLCYLEGLTHDQAADQLGWPVGTVRRRLAGARDRLHGRLTRRGVTPSFLAVGPMDSGMARDLGGSNISVTSRLAEATVCGALRVGSGQAAPSGIISAEVIALMKGASQTMTITKLIAMTAAVLTAGLVTTAVGLLAYPGKSPGTPATPSQAKDREKPGPTDVVDRSPDDQLEAVLRQWDATIEANQSTAKAQMSADQRNALAQANFGKLQDVNTRMLELAVRHPRTNAAEQALIWIATHNNYSPESNRAWEFLARNYSRSDRIKQVLSRQRVGFQWASQSVEDLLRNTLEQNPYREIRGLACYWLAEMLEFRAEGLRLWPIIGPKQAEQWRERFSPQDFERVIKQDPRSLEDEVARLYERIMAEFPMVENNDARCGLPPQILGGPAIHIPDVARVHLNALRRLLPGKPAPEIEGTDLAGRPMKLSDFRGKVVVLFVAGFGVPPGYPPERAPSHVVSVFRHLARSAEGKPVALLGVVETLRETYKKEVEATGQAIRFWWDPEQVGAPVFPRVSGSRPGPILTAWDAEAPNWYVIDAKGVIRYTHVFGPEMLEKAVATILKERESGPGPAK